MTLRYLKAVRRGSVASCFPAAVRSGWKALAQRVRSWPDFVDCAVICAATPQAAVEGADIVATVTTASQPRLSRPAVKPGACIILGGANRPDAARRMTR